MTTKPIRVDGADVSHHQQSLDLAKAKMAGLKFLYQKATEGDSFTDWTYTFRRKEAAAIGLPFGAYHFARAEVTRTGNDAKTEAARFLKVATPKPGDLVPALDLETAEGLSPAQLRNWAADFSAEVWRQLGVLPALYSPWAHTLPNARVVKWVPRYNNLNTPPTIPWDVWQFSNGVYGVPNQHPGLGHVDLNTLADGFRLGNLIIKKGGPEPDEADRSGAFRVMSQNVKAFPLMPQGDVVEDVRLTAGQSGIIGWQEIGPARYKEAILALGPKWETFWGGPHSEERETVRNPISYRVKHWRRVDGGRWKHHDGVARMTPDSWLTWVVLEHKRTGAHVLATNKHYVAGAWNNIPKADKRQRQNMWTDANRFEMVWTERFMAKHPEVAVIGLGDYNSTNHRQLAVGARLGGRKVNYQVAPRAIDQIWLVNAATWIWETDDEDGELLPGRNSDHQGRRSRQRLVLR